MKEGTLESITPSVKKSNLHIKRESIGRIGISGGLIRNQVLAGQDGKRLAKRPPVTQACPNV
jgi:hypothetical protein